MKNILLISLVIIIFGCKVDVGTDENGQFKSISANDAVTFATLKDYVLTPSCVRCHAWVNDEASVQQRIVVGNPEASTLYQKLKSGSMPPTGAISTKYLSLVESYIKNAKAAETIPINSTFKSVQFHLINKSCLTCHNNNGTEISFEGYDNVVRRSRSIINILDEGDDADTPMPPYDANGNRKAPLPTSEIRETFRQWINEGKLNN